MADLKGICHSGCLYKNVDESCRVRLKKGMKRAIKSNSCKLFNDGTNKSLNPYQTKYNTKLCKK